jgi:hypothetical protein
MAFEDFQRGERRRSASEDAVEDYAVEDYAVEAAIGCRRRSPKNQGSSGNVRGSPKAGTLNNSFAPTAAAGSI